MQVVCVVSSYTACMLGFSGFMRRSYVARREKRRFYRHANSHITRTMRTALIGGTDFDEAKLEQFVYKLVAKYPHGTMVTGNGRGAEAQAKTLAEALGYDVVVPELRDDLYGKAALACQINDVLIGADVIVLVGGTSGSRPKIAHDIHKRVDWKTASSHRELRQLHVVAAPPPKAKAAKPRKASKPDRLAA